MSALSIEHLPHTNPLPVLFIGHGSPMHAIEESGFSRAWGAMGESLPTPAAILVVSAHWMTRGSTLVHVGGRPKTIHDFGNFPRALHEVQYPAPGAPEAAAITLDLLKNHHAEADIAWGLDHGAWCVLLNMFPEADVPVYQLSLDLSKPLPDHLRLAQDLRALRRRGVLIVGSGNIVHNLGAMRHGAPAFDWAEAFDAQIAALIENGDYDGAASLNPASPLMRMAHPSYEHFLPLLYTLGAAEAKDAPRFFAEGFDLGSISMRSVVLGA